MTFVATCHANSRHFSLLPLANRNKAVGFILHCTVTLAEGLRSVGWCTTCRPLGQHSVFCLDFLFEFSVCFALLCLVSRIQQQPMQTSLGDGYKYALHTNQTFQPVSLLDLRLSEEFISIISSYQYNGLYYA